MKHSYELNDQAKATYKKYMDLHAALEPYLASLRKSAVEKGVPPVRPLVWRFPEDPAVWNIQDEYLLGDAVLVAPVAGPETEREVYLPKGTNWEKVEGLELNVYLDRKSPEYGCLKKCLTGK